MSTLYEQHVVRLTRTARSILASTADAEDLVHDLFLEVWKEPTGFDPERGTVPVWLRVKARSRALDHQRLEALRGRLVRRFLAEDAQTPQTADFQALYWALKKLTEPQRRVLELAYFDGYTSKQIARILDVPLGTVKSRTKGAMEKLRGALRAGERQRGRTQRKPESAQAMAGEMAASK